MELNIGIICASLPTLRAFLAKFFPNTFRSSIADARQGYNTDQSGQRQLIGNQTDTTQTAGTIVINNEADVEKGRGTFLASDSEAEGPQAPEMAIVSNHPLRH
jgi:hypothetical protein